MASPFTQYPNNIIRPRQVNWDVLSEAFEIVKRHWQAYVLYALVAFVLQAAVGVCFYILNLGMQVGASQTNTDPMALLAATVPLQLFQMFISMALNGIVYGGFFFLTAHVLGGRTPQVGDAFEVLKVLLPLSIAQVLASLFSLPGACACYVGMFFIQGLFILSGPVIIVEKRSAWDALMRSLELVKPHWLTMGLFVAVSMILASLGACACFVGILFTMPWAATAIFLVYRDLSGANFGDPNAVASATPYPRSGPGDMPGYTGPVASEPYAGGPIADVSTPFDPEAAAAGSAPEVPDAPIDPPKPGEGETGPT